MSKHTPRPMKSEKEQINRLANCVWFSLQHLKLPGSAFGLRRNEKGDVVAFNWQDEFCQALEDCGVKIEVRKGKGKK